MHSDTTTIHTNTPINCTKTRQKCQLRPYHPTTQHMAPNQPAAYDNSKQHKTETKHTNTIRITNLLLLLNHGFCFKIIELNMNDTIIFTVTKFHKFIVMQF